MSTPSLILQPSRLHRIAPVAPRGWQVTTFFVMVNIDDELYINTKDNADPRGCSPHATHAFSCFDSRLVRTHPCMCSLAI